MRSTRRLLDRWSPAAVAALTCAAAAIASASCASERDADFGAPEPDAFFEASLPPEDAGADARDAGRFDAGLLPIECASPPCAVALVAGEGESFCAVLRDGTVACWGANGGGQLGRGEASIGSATPARVAGVSDVVALDRTCAVDRSGAAWCWGEGPYRGSDAGVTTETTPVKLDIPFAKKVSASAQTACALLESGVLCWGSNASGQVAVGGPFIDAPAHPPTPIAFGPGASIRDIAVNEASFIVREDGTSESWGANGLLARSSSLYPDPHPLPTPFDRIAAVSVAEGRACAAVGGDAFCWGDDVGPIPQRVVTPEPIVQIATTKSIRELYEPTKVLSPARWCAASVTGAAYCLGNNTAGQAGDGTKNHAPRPVTILGLPAPVARVTTTYQATCALLTTGKIYCVGSNYYGQLGDGAIRRSSLVPVEVSLP